MRFLVCVLLSATVVTLTGCRKGLETKSMTVGDVPLTVEIADTPETRQKGLMFRKSMPENHGMLFVFEREEKRSFWMKNTPLPLSIAYISADGTIREILDMEPFTERSYPSGWSVKYALEVNQGFFERHGIKTGDKVVLPE
jgi:uncharacterized membrane protein (UPF0127 family)